MSEFHDQITLKIREETARLLALDMRRDGLIHFFKSHCLQADGKAADNVRLELHSLLDAALDCQSQQMTLLARLGKHPS